MPDNYSLAIERVGANDVVTRAVIIVLHVAISTCVPNFKELNPCSIYLSVCPAGLEKNNWLLS